MKLQRLDKIISSQFNISRSDTKAEIRRGKVTADGKILKDPSALLNPLESKIIYDGQVLEYKEHIYIVMNKPKGILSASEDKRRETVVDLIKEPLKRNGLFPVGRLDRDTTGLLLITDDGDFAHKVISPKNNIFKTYIVELDGAVTEDIVSQFEQGITLADGTKCLSAKIERITENVVKISVCEGKYHQIKRMFGVVGLGVNELKRDSIGNLSLPKD